jgi:hypothetical protein
MIRSEKAVSEVIGMVMILFIMMIVIGAILLVGVPMIESGKSRARMDVAANSFLSLQNDIEEVVRGPIWVTDPYGVANINRLGPSRETEFELMGGTITISSNKMNVTCSYNNCSRMDVNNFSIVVPASNIIYEADNELIIYENGAVLRKYESGEPLMLSNPLISIYNNGSGGTIISIHAISINGTNSSTGGDGKAFVETRLINYSQIIEPAPSDQPNLNQTNITINTKNIEYSGVWGNFFDRKLNESGLAAKSGYNISLGPPLVIQITGIYNTAAKDIFLSMYETRLDVKVR